MSTAPQAEWPVSLDSIRQAAQELSTIARVTPIESSHALEKYTGVPTFLKCENLQRSGSFKVRGAYVRMNRLSAEEKARGVIAASAGNHAQGVAVAAAALGISAVVYMPVSAALPKVAATRDYGAEVRLVGANVEEALAAAKAEAERTGAIFIHPFDHADVIAGQGTLALEILEQVPLVKTVMAPVGGGGLVAGLVAAFAQLAPEVKVVGVQASRAAAYTESLIAGHPVTHPAQSTMADGIAVSTPGDLPFEIIDRGNTRIVNVSEEDISKALLYMAERAKLVVEPAGVTGIAALMAYPGEFEGPVVALLSGGNIDPNVLLRVVRHGLVSAGRFLVVKVRLDDHPGALAQMLFDLASQNANIMHVGHVRTGVDLAIDEVEVTMQVETKGPDHCTEVLEFMRSKGYKLS
ncbi:threonine ammonia-lyase [Timonella senegalensis]|uniref:threonine ammonia-lyase n=1 Tax=Timonella senegalensis TaxID=1465825 RepID=UPI000315C135|nr:threonine ammonia-lyase [Timonella senegalensis]